MNQEYLALSIVGITVLGLCIRFYRNTVAETLARRLLKSGHVKWAMRIRSHVSSKGSCSKCKD